MLLSALAFATILLSSISLLVFANDNRIRYTGAPYDLNQMPKLARKAQQRPMFEPLRKRSKESSSSSTSSHGSTHSEHMTSGSRAHRPEPFPQISHNGAGELTYVNGVVRRLEHVPFGLAVTLRRDQPRRPEGLHLSCEAGDVALVVHTTDEIHGIIINVHAHDQAGDLRWRRGKVRELLQRLPPARERLSGHTFAAEHNAHHREFGEWLEREARRQRGELTIEWRHSYYDPKVTVHDAPALSAFFRVPGTVEVSFTIRRTLEWLLQEVRNRPFRP